MTAKKGCGRPIGARVREVLQILGRIGPARRKEVLPYMVKLAQWDDPSKYLRRAVEYGLAEQVSERPARYRAVCGWQEALERVIETVPATRLRVSSVWELGSVGA